MNTQIEEIIKQLKQEIKLKEEKASRLVLEKDSEEKLYELIAFKEWLNDEIENLKQEIVKKAEEIRKNFRGFSGNKLFFRYYKSKTYYKIADINNIKKDFVIEIIQHRTNNEKIRKYKEETGKLPEGVVEEIAPPKLEIKLRQYEETTIEPHSD